METCKPVNSPMTAEDFKDDDRKKTEAQLKVLPQGAARLYRRGTAFAVYMSQDRQDLSAAACQLATRMQEPTEYDWERLKRLCRYVKACPRCVLCYPWQHQENTNVKLTTDSDWANEARTRKSHSGGMLQIGHHLVQHWCRRQPVIALSSGEAELYSSVCGLTRMLGLVNVLREMRGQMWGDPLVHALDASACKSMLLRHGSGGLKHLETKNSWVQEAVKSKHIKVVKIAREVNAADSLACFSATNILRDHMRLVNCELIDRPFDRIFRLLLHLDHSLMGIFSLQLLCLGSSSPIQTASDCSLHRDQNFPERESQLAEWSWVCSQHSCQATEFQSSFHS